jgi:hypothetical protein
MWLICKGDTNSDLSKAIQKLANNVSRLFAFFSLNALKKKRLQETSTCYRTRLPNARHSA